MPGVFWENLGISMKKGLKLSLDDLFSLYQVLYFVASKLFIASQLSHLSLVERDPKDPEKSYKKPSVKNRFFM